MKLFITNILLFILACSSPNVDNKKSVTEIKIPENAFWAGGSKGGNWYLVESINDHRNAAQIKIYNEQDGSLIVSKKFTLICPVNSIVFIGDLKQQISGFDGTKIFFRTDGITEACWLE